MMNDEQDQKVLGLISPFIIPPSSLCGISVPLWLLKDLLLGELGEDGAEFVRCEGSAFGHSTREHRTNGGKAM